MNQKWIKNILTVFFLAVFVYAAGNLFLIWQEYRASEKLYEQAQTEFLTAPELDETFETDEPVTWPEFTIDFAHLEQVNPEVNGWVWIYDTVVNYPLVQSGINNDAYLAKTYDGTRNSSGSIFMDYRNSGDYSDDNTVIYGHNMKNGKMFAVLKKFQNQEFYDGHREFYIMTAEGNRRYEIISMFQTDALSDIYDRNFASREAKEAWLAKVVRRSAILSPFTATADDDFVTLSTCVSGDDYRARFVVIGRLAEIEPLYCAETEAEIETDEEIPAVEAGELSE